MTASIATDPIAPGDIIEGKYRITNVVGRGGMGIVFSAFHLELEQSVAIKVLATGTGGTEKTAVERFVREAKAAALVKGEHVCRVFDVGRLRTSGHPFIVMEYLEGGDLARKIEHGAKPPITDVVSWVVQACDALSSAHARGIVHRDIKPANLFLHRDESGQEVLKVLDFGISKIAKAGNHSLTQTTSVMGSPLYMSPEQLASSRNVDLRSDIWSLGVVMYELLTGGVVPFEAETVVQLAISVREEKHLSASHHRPDVPLGLDQAIDRCLSKKPEERFSSVHDLVAELGPFAPPEVGSIVSRLSKLAKNPLAVPSSKPRIMRSSPDADPWSGLPSIASVSGEIDGTEPTQVDRSRPGSEQSSGSRPLPDRPSDPIVPSANAKLQQTLDPVQTVAPAPKFGKNKLVIGVAIVAAIVLALVAFVRMARGTPTTATPSRAPQPEVSEHATRGDIHDAGHDH